MYIVKNPAKSRPLSANVRRLMKMARELPLNPNVKKIEREFTARNLAYCDMQGNACISQLESVVYVQVLVNPTAEKLVIRPCEEGAQGAIRWCIAKENKRKSRQITCGPFTAKLYEMMGWEALYRYKLQGTRISYRGEQLYVFDLTGTEIFLPAVKDPDNPKARAKLLPLYNAQGMFGVYHLANAPERSLSSAMRKPERN